MRQKKKITCEVNLFGRPLLEQNKGTTPIWLIVSLVAIYIAVFKWTCVPQTIQQIIKVACIYCVLLYAATNINKKLFAHVIVPFVVAITVSTVAGYLNGYVHFDNFVDAVFYGVCLYCAAILVSHCLSVGYTNTLLNVLFWMTALYCLLTFFFTLYVGTSDGLLLYYFAGNKFTSSYYFIFLVGINYARLCRRGASRSTLAISSLFICVLAAVFSRYVFCSTAFVMSFAAAVLVTMPDKMKNVFRRPFVVLLSLVVAALFLSALDAVLSNATIRYLVVEVLGENLTLTGRDPIYQALPSVIGESPLFGFGYGNSAVAMHVGYGNAQNAVMETIVNYGVFGIAMLAVAIARIFRGDKPAWAWGAYIIVYAMILGSVVEITFDYFFFIGLFLIEVRDKQDDLSVNELEETKVRHDKPKPINAFVLEDRAGRRVKIDSPDERWRHMSSRQVY